MNRKGSKKSFSINYGPLPLFVACVLAIFRSTATASEEVQSAEDNVQAQMVFTVAEGKRLVAKAVAQMPVVKRALKDGMVIICKGTTTTYVAEEILGKRIEHGALVSGRTYPEKGGHKLDPKTTMPEVILIKGQLKTDLTLDEAVKQLKRGDVVIKGANALYYEQQLAAGIIGAPDSGTTGKIVPYVTGTKAHLIIPVGLEKQVAHSPIEITRQLQKPMESLNWVPGMFLFTAGEIVTEIEALQILANVRAFQAAAGGIGGAEGAVRLVCRGPRKAVQQALELAELIYGEPPFARADEQPEEGQRPEAG